MTQMDLRFDFAIFIEDATGMIPHLPWQQL
jgi:hypothetical protein